MEKLWIRIIFTLLAISAIPMFAFVALVVFGATIYYSIAEREPIKDVWHDIMDDDMCEVYSKYFNVLKTAIIDGELPDEI